MAVPIRHPYHTPLKILINTVLIFMMGMTLLEIGQGQESVQSVTLSAYLTIAASVVSLLTVKSGKHDKLSTVLILFGIVGASFALVLQWGGIQSLVVYVLPIYVLLAAILTTSRETVLFSIVLAIAAFLGADICFVQPVEQSFGVIVAELWAMAFAGLLLIAVIDQQHQSQTKTILEQLETNAQLQWILGCEERAAEYLFQRLSDNIRQEQDVFSRYHTQVALMRPDHVLVKPIQILHKQMQQLANYVDTEQSMVIQLRHTPLSDVYDSMHSLFAQHPQHASVNVQFNMSYDENDMICVDLPRLEQVWINLFRNSLRYTESGEIRIDVLKEAGRYRFQFLDTGCGIPVSEQNRIFQIFEQGTPGAHTEGLGIGLALASGILRQMDSRLFLKSVEGKGTVFWFFIGLVSDEVVAS